MLDSHEIYDTRVLGIGDPVVLRNVVEDYRKHHVDGDDMTYDPIASVTGGLRLSSAGTINGNAYDVRTSTQRHDELVAAVEFLTQKVNTLERRIEKMQGD